MTRRCSARAVGARGGCADGEAVGLRIGHARSVLLDSPLHAQGRLLSGLRRRCYDTGARASHGCCGGTAWQGRVPGRRDVRVGRRSGQVQVRQACQWRHDSVRIVSRTTASSSCSTSGCLARSGLDHSSEAGLASQLGRAGRRCIARPQSRCSRHGASSVTLHAFAPIRRGGSVTISLGAWAPEALRICRGCRGRSGAGQDGHMTQVHHGVCRRRPSVCYVLQLCKNAEVRGQVKEAAIDSRVGVHVDGQGADLQTSGGRRRARVRGGRGPRWAWADGHLDGAEHCRRRRVGCRGCCSRDGGHRVMSGVRCRGSSGWLLICMQSAC